MNGMNERTFHARDLHKLEDPQRLTWIPRDEVIARIGPSRGMTIADVGAGTGFFAIPFAQAVGDTGSILAVDFQKEMLAGLGAKLSPPGAPKNVTLVEGEASRTTLQGECCDIVFMSNLWHELDDEPGVLREVHRLLRPGGRLAILDWRADVPPPPGPPAAHRVSLGALRDVLSRNGWPVDSAEHIGMYSHLLIAGRPAKDTGR